MDIDQIEQLIEKFYEGKTSLEEEQQLRTFFRNEDVPEKLRPHADYFRYTGAMGDETADPDFDPFAKLKDDSEASITAMDRRAKRESPKGWSNRTLKWSLRVAAGVILLLTGFVAGQFLTGNEGASTRQVAALQQEVRQMKDALMHGGSYRQASAGERLSAVKMSTRFASNNKQLDQQITDILIYTMNNDQSVNVRMAAAEALFKFRDERQIQQALVNSLTQQDDPQMQLTLINMLVKLKAKGAVNEMNKLLMDSDTRKIVRERLQAGIAELQT